MLMNIRSPLRAELVESILGKSDEIWVVSLALGSDKFHFEKKKIHTHVLNSYLCTYTVHSMHVVYAYLSTLRIFSISLTFLQLRT